MSDNPQTQHVATSSLTPQSSQSPSSGKLTAFLPGHSVAPPAGRVTKKIQLIRELLLDKAEAVVERVADVALNPIREETEQPCALCGRGMMRDEDLMLKAQLGLLDRAGIGTKQEMALTGADGSPLLPITQINIIVLAGRAPQSDQEE